MALQSPASLIREQKGNEFPYDAYMAAERLPVHRAVIGVDDVTALPRKPWARTGGSGAFIQLEGTYQSERGLYVADIPGGGSLSPEQHLYEEEIFILEGRGTAQVWQGEGAKIAFEWGPGSVFAIPPNTTHRLMNGGREPVVFLGATTAPRVMNALYDFGIVFHSDYQFVDLYAHDNYFLAPEARTTEGWYKQVAMHTNFIADSRAVLLDDMEQKVAGGQITLYRMGKSFPHGHISEWPSGRYHKAHYHEPGAVLLGLDGEGYVLAWDSKLGARPYRDGKADQVQRLNWGRNSIYSPPNAYFHQHFNTGAGPAKHIAVYGDQIPIASHGLYGTDGWKGHLSFREGGTLIEYEDEDPRILEEFEATLTSKGLTCAMPKVNYRD